MITSDKILNNLIEYDFIVIPGGSGVKDIAHDKEFIEWIKTASDKSTITSVSGGSIILGVARLLKEKKATTHPVNGTS